MVYADWLDERSDPRADFLRLDVEQRRPENNGKKRQTQLANRMRDLTPKLDARWVGTMWRTRNLPLGVRLDLTSVADGKGLIEVRGGEGDTLLFVEGKPIALNWNDCHGSVGQYLVFTGHTRGNEHWRQLASLVEGEVDTGRPLAEQIGPLLALFTPGIYCVGYVPSAVAEGADTFEYSGGSNTNRELIGYYPDGQRRNLVCTQTRESLDQDRVEFYCEQIRAKRRPIVLTTSAEGAWCEFVIDGHHKLDAYNREQVRPAVLAIDRWQAPGISLAEGLRCMPRGHPGVREYRRLKRYSV